MSDPTEQAPESTDAETTALVLAGLTDWLAAWGQAQRETQDTEAA